MNERERVKVAKELMDLKETRSGIESVVNMAEKMKNAYFWTNDRGSASQRRRYDREHSASYRWDEGGHHYEAAFSTCSSVANIYTYRNYFFDGKRTNLTKIKGSLKRIENMISEKAEILAREEEKAEKRRMKRLAKQKERGDEM